jgi:hypothetical protein
MIPPNARQSLGRWALLHERGGRTDEALDVPNPTRPRSTLPLAELSPRRCDLLAAAVRPALFVGRRRLPGHLAACDAEADQQPDAVSNSQSELSTAC